MAEKGKENVHKGHRERLRSQFRENGLEGFTDIQALELLLFYVLGQKDTNELAHTLLDHFGGFRGVMEASAAELKEVKGIGEEAATLITLVTALNRRYFDKGRKPRQKLSNTDEICEYVQNLFRYKTAEELYMLCLDGDHRVMSIHKMGVGSVASVNLPLQEICIIALRERAVGVVLTHNHLTDIAVASDADIMSTGRLSQALQLIGVELIDHIIVADDDSVSMRDSRHFRNFTNLG